MLIACVCHDGPVVLELRSHTQWDRLRTTTLAACVDGRLEGLFDWGDSRVQYCLIEKHGNRGMAEMISSIGRVQYSVE